MKIYAERNHGIWEIIWNNGKETNAFHNFKHHPTKVLVEYKNLLMPASLIPEENREEIIQYVLLWKKFFVEPQKKSLENIESSLEEILR